MLKRQRRADASHWRPAQRRSRLYEYSVIRAAHTPTCRKGRQNADLRLPHAVAARLRQIKAAAKNIKLNTGPTERDTALRAQSAARGN